MSMILQPIPEIPVLATSQIREQKSRFVRISQGVREPTLCLIRVPQTRYLKRFLQLKHAPSTCDSFVDTARAPKDGKQAPPHARAQSVPAAHQNDGCVCCSDVLLDGRPSGSSAVIMM